MRAASRLCCLARATFAVAGVMHATCVMRSLLPRSPRKQTRPSESNNGPQNRTCSPWTALWAWTRDIVTAIAGIACDMSAGHAVRRVGRAARRMHLRYHIWCGNEAARSGSIDATEAALIILGCLMRRSWSSWRTQAARKSLSMAYYPCIETILGEPEWLSCTVVVPEPTATCK